MTDEQDEARDVLPEATQHTGRRISGSPAGLRQRPLGRVSTFAESTPISVRRGSSFVSDSLSDSRRSLKASTDDLLLPRATVDQDIDSESSHWHSLPLGLALLPAVGGLFFQNGSAFVTDISLLAIAALFLNWAVRLPWQWYLSAQAIVADSEPQDFGSAIESDGSDIVKDESPSPERNHKSFSSNRAWTAQNELRLHELLALLACFVFPALGTWLLHTIRTQLSRPSESLISDYNLTIFLLASEVRPLSHLIKLVQRRTLFLQRTIRVAGHQTSIDRLDPAIQDMAKRLEELEGHVASSVVLSGKSEPDAPSQTDDLIAKASLQANTDVRKTFQPELDALNRAMRRYEKRTMTSAIEVETRLQNLEKRVQDVVILAAATQRNADKKSGQYTAILANWIAACVVVPAQYAIYVLTLPHRMLIATMNLVKRKLGIRSPTRSQKPKSISRPDQPRRKSSKERVKVT